MHLDYTITALSDRLVQLSPFPSDHQLLIRLYRGLLADELLSSHWDIQLTEGFITFIKPDGFMSVSDTAWLESHLQQVVGLIDLAVETEFTVHEFEVAFSDSCSPDLARLAEQAGMSRSSWIKALCSSRFTVAFNGFLPGFSYLTGLPEVLQAPRLSQPRTQVPAGSVAIAAHYCAIYPSVSPGGWNLVGQVERRVFNAEQEPPSLMLPGDQVVFRPFP